MNRFSEFAPFSLGDKLNELQEMALGHNHDLKSAIANMRKVRALARIDQSNFFPTVMSNPSFERSRTTQNSFTSTSASTKSFISPRTTASRCYRQQYILSIRCRCRERTRRKAVSTLEAEVVRRREISDGAHDRLTSHACSYGLGGLVSIKAHLIPSRNSIFHPVLPENLACGC